MTTSVRRAIDILRALRAASAPRSLTAISHAVELPIPTTRRLLADLSAAELVSYNRGRRGYQLGPGLLALASGLWSEGTLSAAVTPAMAAIRDETGLTIELSLLSGGRRTVVCEAQSTRPLRYANGVGSSAPLHAGAAGRALLAFCAAPIRDAVLAGELERLTPATITSRAELQESLRSVREMGYAHSDGERALGVMSVAVPIIDQVTAVAMGVLAAVGPHDAFPVSADQLAARLANEVKTTLGAAMSGFV